MRRPGIAPNQKLTLKAARRLAPRVLRLALPYWRELTVGFAALAAGSGINLLLPYLLRRLLNGELGFRLERDLALVTLFLVCLFALQALVFFVRHRTFASAGYRVVSDLRKRLYSSTIAQDIAFFDSAKVGDLLSRLSADTQLLQNAVTMNVSIAARYLLQIIGGIALMLFISIKLSLIILILVPVIMLLGRFWGAKLASISKLMQSRLGEASVVAEESLSAPRTVQVFAGADYESTQYAKHIDAALDSGVTRANVAATFSSTMVFLMHSSIAVVLYFGGRYVLDQTLSLGDLSAFILYCVIVAVSFGFLVSAFDEFMQSLGAAERIFDVIDRPKKILSAVTPRPFQQTSLHVAFEGVDFAYPSRPELKVLSQITFEIKDGETLALVGPSGSGKSSIAALIPRYYDPTSGQIRYRGVPLKDLSLEALRAEISVVAQDCQVFSSSIRENIRYGRPNASEVEVNRAVEDSALSEFIASLPQGLDTLVGDRGVQLSGGQRQRLAIARAIIKDPKFLILDEATSALDSENEALIQSALKRLMLNRTTLIIAHRLSTVQHAHQIMVIKDGSILERGSHDDLMRTAGIYSSLVKLQMLQ